MALITSFVLALSLFLFAQALFSLFLMLYTWENPERLKVSSGPSSFLSPRLSFTVLLPARHEEAVIFQTIKRVWAANYPSDLLEIVVICHAEDFGTVAEARRAIQEIGSPRVRVETFSGEPINKPRGLNVGLERTTNEVVTIFDAEDDVDPDVFNVINTVMIEEEIGVVQAGVQLMNFRSHWFSVHNCLEYFFYYKSRLHFHAKVGMITLGGNTVFFRRSLLERIGGWDEGCLTEDADIGIRLSALGEPIRVVYNAQHVTREETPDSVASFVKQRTRWSQGFLQILRSGSWLELPRLSQKLLAFYTLSYSIFQGLVTVLWPLAIIGVFLIKVPTLVAIISFLPMYTLLLQLLINIAGAYYFTKEYGLKRPLLLPASMAVTFVPFHILLGVGAIRAVYREARSQTNWEKTKHMGAHRNTEIIPPAEYEMLLKDAFERLNVERGSVMALDNAQDSFVMAASRNVPADADHPTRVSTDRGVVGWVALNGTPIIINGHEEVPSDLRTCLNQPGLLSSIVAPIQRRGSTVAVLSLSSRQYELDHNDLRWVSDRISTLFEAPTVAIREVEKGGVFELGEQDVSEGTEALMESMGGLPVAQCLGRHRLGDWGEIDDENRYLNGLSLEEGGSLGFESAYTVGGGTVLRILTFEEGSGTLLLTEEEYQGALRSMDREDLQEEGALWVRSLRDCTSTRTIIEPQGRPFRSFRRVLASLTYSKPTNGSFDRLRLRRRELEGVREDGANGRAEAQALASAPESLASDTKQPPEPKPEDRQIPGSGTDGQDTR